MSDEKVIHRASVEGRVVFMRSEDKSNCKCCAESTIQPGHHIFARGVNFDDFQSKLPDYFGQTAKEFVFTHTSQTSFEGKRVRLTVEVLDE